LPDNICTKSRNPFLCLIASLTNSQCPVYCNRNSGDCPNVFSLSNRLCDEPNISPLHRFLFLAVPTHHQTDCGSSGCSSRSHECISPFRLCLQIIKRTADLLDALLGHMGVYLCRLAALVPEQLLDVAQVRSCFEEMSGIGMPQTMK